MGISLDITSESWGADSKDWLASRKGFDTCESVTLDLSLFLAAHYEAGFIPSGTVLAKVTATGMYGPYDNAAGDGRTVATGHLFDGVRVTDSAGNTFARSGAAMLWEGVVLEAKLPLFTGTVLGELDANAKADLKFMKYM
jgi:hypothetical protein